MHIIYTYMYLYKSLIYTITHFSQTIRNISHIQDILMTSCGGERWGMYHRVVNCLLHWKEEKKEDGDFRLSPSVGTWFTGLQQSWCGSGSLT